MTYKEYKESLADFKATITDTRGTPYNGKFGRFQLQRGWQAVWSIRTKNVVAAFNKEKQLLRVRSNSLYFDGLSEMKGFTVIRSDSLSDYRSKRGNIDEVTYTSYVGDPYVRLINGMKEEQEVTIDFGSRANTRRTVFMHIYNHLRYRSDKDALANATNGGSVVPRKTTVKLGVRVQGGRQSAVGYTYTTSSNFGVDVPW